MLEREEAAGALTNREGTALAFLALTLFGGAATALADPITITAENSNTGIDNVLFNNASLQHSGTFVQGDFNGSGTGYIVRFTSSGGNLQVGGGQASLEGGTGNTPFSNLKFGLEGDATFTKAVFNIDVTNGLEPPDTVTFTVNYFDTINQTYVSSVFTVNTNGQNYFTVESGMSALIQSIEINSTDATFDEVNQVRLGGFARATPEPTTMLLLGSGLVGIAARKRRRRKAAKSD